jgi:hypothetical protein
MSILADIAVAPVLVMFPLLGLLWFGLVVLLETLVFRWLQWGTMRRSLLDTLVANIISTVVGIFLYGAFLAVAFQCTSIPINNGRNVLHGCAWNSFTIPGLIALWLLSTLIEGAALLRLRRHPARQTWRTALIANFVSYLLLSPFLLALF